MIYHLVAEGVAWIQVERGLPVGLCPGDIVIFPNGDPHMMGYGPPTKPVDNGEQLQQIMSQGLTPVRTGGGGEVTKFICG